MSAKKRCGQCNHAHRLDDQPADDVSLTCFHSPPTVIVHAIQIKPTVGNPRGGVANQMSVAYPRVVANFPACGQWTDNGVKMALN